MIHSERAVPAEVEPWRVALKATVPTTFQGRLKGQWFAAVSAAATGTLEGE